MQDDRLGETIIIRKLAIVTGLTVLLTPMLIACTSSPAAAPSAATSTHASAEPATPPTPLPQSIKPPTTTGTTLTTWVSQPQTLLGRPIDAHGEGLLIAFDCAGKGTVTVDTSDGTSSTFQCTSDSVLSYGNHDNQAHGQSTVLVSTTGDVVLGLTIGSTPLTDSSQG